MKAIYTIYYEVNRKCFDRKIGDTVTKRRIFSTFEDALKYARRYTKTTKNINYVDTVVFENIYELTFEPTEVEAEIFTPVKKNKMYQLDTKGMDKDLRVENKEYRIYIGDDSAFGIQTVGLQSALELGQSYAKYHAGEKITVIDEDKNIVKEFFEEKKELVKSNIKDKTNFKPRYLTKKEYDETHQSFSSWARVGDIVDEQIVEEFRDCIFPVAYDAMYLQCGEPYTHEINPKTGKWEPVFITFARKLGSWVYKGICFYREYEDVG